MAHSHTTNLYSRLYAMLLRLYPRSFSERFGEGMGQTFNDLCRERREANKGLLAFALWMFVETSAGIIRENMRSIMVQYKNIVRITFIVALMLLLPLVAMQFTDEVSWSVGDFVVAGVLLFGAGFTYELVSRKAGTTAYRAAVGVAVAGGLILVWMNLAVGLIGSEGELANLMYIGVLAVGFIGAVIARLRPHGMARALFSTALAQALVPVIALFIQVTSWGAAGVVGVFFVNTFFVMLFVVSGLLFRRASDPHRT